MVVKTLPTISISVQEISANPWNPNVMPAAGFELLTASIDDIGFAQNVLVAPRAVMESAPDDKMALRWCEQNPDVEYVVVWGEHRWRASRLMDEDAEISAVVLPADTPLPKIKALVSSGNALTGEIDPRRWTRLYQDVQKEYGEEAAKTMMGIYQERQFRRLYREVKKALPADMQDELDAKKDKIKSIEGLGQALNTLVAEYGETLPLNFMVFTWGGKVHYMIRMNATLKGTMDAIAQSCKASERDINEVLSLAIQKGWGNRVDSG